MSLVHLLLFAGLVIAASSSSPGSRLILREISDQKDKAVELNTTNFDSVLKDTPAKYAVVEFFAHWSVLRLLFTFHLNLHFWLVGFAVYLLPTEFGAGSSVGFSCKCVLIGKDLNFMILLVCFFSNHCY
jgi:hypothetical protein